MICVNEFLKDPSKKRHGWADKLFTCRQCNLFVSNEIRVINVSFTLII